MDRMIYSALSGMRASMTETRMLANNMANINTPGFRAELMQYSPTRLEGEQVKVRALQNGWVMGARMDQGQINQTGQPLDIALSGKIMMAVQAPDGSEAYTRRGDLNVTPSGLLVNGVGHPVMGEGGAITVPLTGELSISDDGRVMISDNAQPGAPAQEVARIKLVSYEGSPIAKGLDNLFRVEDGGVLPVDETARLRSGALEQSNVNSTRVLTSLMEAQRLYEMRAKLLTTVRQVDESGSGLMRLS